MRVAFIGFGEVGQTLATDLLARGVTDVSAWDVLFTRPDSNPRRAAAGKVKAAGNAGEALQGAAVVISAVTAGQCVAAAQNAAQHVPPGAYFLDLNSVSPRSKRDAAAQVASGRGLYVEAAVMAPIGPKRIASPILLGGPHARAFAGIAQLLGMTGSAFYSDDLGKAAAAKMCRSVMIKGLESLLSESLLAARHYGVEREVLESLQNLLPATDWTQLSRYMISRSLLHGRRRAEEMREAAQSVREAGIDLRMSDASALRQDWAASLGVDPATPTLEAMLDAMLRASGELRC
jgi:3-hydroxyisobutyrate dehydrogenase-like beta-hydroxyacid dehydrogenase